MISLVYVIRLITRLIPFGPNRSRVMKLLGRFTLPRPSLFGRSLILFLGEVMANATMWIVAGLLFGFDPDTRPVLSLCLLAWVRY